MVNIKIFGLQRTGTNWLRALLQRNYKVDVMVNQGGWKHGQISWFAQEWNYIIVLTKHPAAWLVSLWGHMNREYRGQDYFTAQSLAEFIRHPFIIPGVTPPKPHKWRVRASNPIQHYNNTYYHWLSITPGPPYVSLIKYEELLAHPEEELDCLAHLMGLQRIGNEWDPVSKTVNPSDDRCIALSNQDFARTSYYLQERYWQEFNEEQVRWIESQLDHDLMVRLGYRERARTIP